MAGGPGGFAADRHPFRWFILGGVWLLYFDFGLTSLALAPLVGEISQDLRLNHSIMGAIMGAWPLIFIASAIPCGTLLDRLGARRSLLVGSLVIGLSGILRGLATDDVSLFLAVAVFGLGAPLISIGAPKLISRWFSGQERGLAMGIYVTGPGLGGIVALSLTNGFLVPQLGADWRTVLLIYATFVLSCGLVWLIISGHKTARLAARQDGQEIKIRQLQAIFALLHRGPVRLLLLIGMGSFFFNHALTNWLPEILRSGGMGAAEAGYWAAVPAAIGIIGSLTIPRLATPSRRLGILLALFLFAGIASALLQSTDWPVLSIGLVFQGIARSSISTIAILILIETPGVSSRHVGLACGMFYAVAEIGGVLGPLSLGLVSDLTGGFSWALVMLTGDCAILMLLVSCFMWMQQSVVSRPGSKPYSETDKRDGSVRQNRLEPPGEVP